MTDYQREVLRCIDLEEIGMADVVKANTEKYRKGLSPSPLSAPTARRSKAQSSALISKTAISNSAARHFLPTPSRSRKK